MVVVTSTVTTKTIRVVWKDSSPRRSKNTSKAVVERKEKIDESVDEELIFTFPLY